MIKVLKLTPEVYKTRPPPNLTYGTAPTQFGPCFLAFDNHILAYLDFAVRDSPLDDLKRLYPKATVTENQSDVTVRASRLFDDDLEIYLKGTEFEVEVWQQLLTLKKGTTTCYEDVAKALGRPKAVRAVARAVAKNRVGWIVPCHRVIGKKGDVGKYGGGVQRKVALLRSEGAL